MSLSNKQISSILHMIADTTHRMIDAIDNNNDLSASDLRAMRNTMMKKMCDVSLDDFMAHRRANHRLLIKRGTDSENNAYIGKNGEITVDTDKKTLRVHDGITAGGVTMARISDIVGDWVIETQLPTAENNYTWYRKYKSGWVEMGGNIVVSSTKIVATTFPIPFAYKPNVISNAFGNNSSSGNWYGYPIKGTLTTTGCSFSVLEGDGISWFACGIAA